MICSFDYLRLVCLAKVVAIVFFSFDSLLIFFLVCGQDLLRRETRV